MIKARLDGLLLLLLGSAMFVLVGSAMEHMATGSMQDFKGVYYGTRCALEHCDPYSENELLRVYLAEGGERPSNLLAAEQRQVVTLCVYFPTIFIFVAPFAMLAWGPAHVLWLILTAASTRDEADVDVAFGRVADLLHPLGLQHAEQLALGFHAQVGHFVEEQRALSGPPRTAPASWRWPR